MHSGYEIPGVHHQHHQQPPENSCPPLILSMNPAHILDQIHTLPTTQQITLDHHHHHHHPPFLPPHHHYQTRPSHHYPPTAASSAYFPLNFKLGLNEIRSTNDGAAVNGGADALLRGSEHYELPEARQSSLGMLHSPFWEPLQAEVSNENSEIIDRHEMRQRETLTACLDSKNRVHYSELEAIYKRLGNSETIQTAPSHLSPVTAHASDPSVDEEPSRSFRASKKTRTKKKKTTTTNNNQLVSPMAEFFENLVKQMVDHQENLQKKFTAVMDRLNEERREREEAWRSQELAHFEREAAARAHEKAMAKNREAMIVSYLEKITGQRINLPPAVNASYDSNYGADDESERRRD